MKVEYVNPFIEAVQDLFSNTLGCEAKRGDVGVVREVPPNRDIVTLIGLSGPARGTVAISFPVTTALSMVTRLMGREVRVVDEVVKDGVVELVNMIAGEASAKFGEDHESPIELGLPTVVRGSSYSVDYPSHSVWLEVPFESELGEFSLRVTLEIEGTGTDET